MPTNVIQNQNSFEPLQHEDINQRNSSSRKGNGAIQGHNTSSSSSENRSRNTGSGNSIRQKKVVLAGDSTLKYLQGHKQVKVATFPGCTTQDMRDHIKPLLHRNPDEIIIHVGTNSLRSFNAARECAAELINKVRISQLRFFSCDYYIQSHQPF